MNSLELNSIMLYIHPPLAIIGFVLVFLFAILLFQKKNIEKRKTMLTGLGLWLFTFFGFTHGHAMGSNGLGKLLVLGSYRNHDISVIFNGFS